MTEYCSVRGDLLSEAGDAALQLKALGQQRLGDLEMQERRMLDLMAFINSALGHHVMPPVGIAARKENVRHKIQGLLHQVRFLHASCWTFGYTRRHPFADAFG